MNNTLSDLQSVQVKGAQFFVRPGTWDHTILYHVSEYSVSKHTDFPPDTCIVDIGGHIGGFAKLVALQYPTIPIYTIEPDPANFSILKRNISELPNVHPFNGAIGPADSHGVIEIPSPLNTGMNRVLPQDGGGVSIVCPSTLFRMIPERNIGLLKIDCEGGEWPFFDTISSSDLSRIWEIQGELHVDQFVRYLPFKDFPRSKDDFVRDLLKKRLPEFHIFVEKKRTLKAYNKAHFL